MSDQKAIIVGDTKIHVDVHLAAEHRYRAVEIALEMIKSTCAGCGSSHLRTAMNELSGHADKIEEALKKE